MKCSVHLDARMNHARNVIQPFSDIHDFVRSVQLVARMIPPQCVIHDFGCSVHLDARPNHARSVIHDFVQQVARYGEIPPRCVIDDFVQPVARYDSFIFKAFDGARFTACADNRLI